MAELGGGDGTDYPASLDTDSVQETDNSTTARADVPNDLAAAVVAIETELGTDPAGNYTNVVSRLNAGSGQLLSFFMDDVKVSLDDDDVWKGVGDVHSYLMLHAGKIIAIGVYSNGDRTAGTLQVEVTKNGTKQGATVRATLDGTNVNTHVTTGASIAFASGNRIGVVITTSADWAPTTADITVEVLVE